MSSKKANISQLKCIKNKNKSRKYFWAVRLTNNSLITCMKYRFVLIKHNPKLFWKHTCTSIQMLKVERQFTRYLPTPERPSDILKITIRIPQRVPYSFSPRIILIKLLNQRVLGKKERREDTFGKKVRIQKEGKVNRKQRCVPKWLIANINPQYQFMNLYKKV